MINIRAFIIYIEANDRSLKLVKSLNQINITYEKVLSLSRFKDEETLGMIHKGESLYQYTIGRNLLIPELGASFGHFKAIQRFYDSQFEYGIIFDDDARMVADPTNLLSKIAFAEPTCLSLCENLSGVPFFRNSSPEFLRLHFPSTMTTHAYILNRGAAREFLRIFKTYGITSVADWPYPLPRVRYAITQKPYFFQEIDEKRYSVEDERKWVSTVGTQHALSMPIPPLNLAARIVKLREFGFAWNEISRQEIILRFRVRRYLAIRKVARAFRNRRFKLIGRD